MRRIRHKKEGIMKVEVRVLFSEGCENTPLTIELIRKISSELGTEIDLRMVPVENQVQAQQLKFLGSPTVQVNGLDIEPSARSATAFGFM